MEHKKPVMFLASMHMFKYMTILKEKILFFFIVIKHATIHCLLFLLNILFGEWTFFWKLFFLFIYSLIKAIRSVIYQPYWYITILSNLCLVKGYCFIIRGLKWGQMLQSAFKMNLLFYPCLQIEPNDIETWNLVYWVFMW